jgi:hypothetical protein
MSGPQYWGSLWKGGLFIYLSLLCIFIGIGIFIFLYDRISAFQIWNLPFWLKLKIPVIILGVAGLGGAIVLFARSEGKKELRLAMKYAEARGWKFSREDTDGLKPYLAEILDDLKFDLHHIRTVAAGQRSLVLFDCSYKRKEASARQNYSYGTACMVRSDRFLSAGPPVKIITRDWTEMMISGKIDMGKPPFTENYLVLSRDPTVAKASINEGIQSIMLEHLEKPLYNPVCVTIGPGGAVVLTGRTFEHERLEGLLDMACRIEEAIQ